MRILLPLTGLKSGVTEGGDSFNKRSQDVQGDRRTDNPCVAAPHLAGEGGAPALLRRGDVILHKCPIDSSYGDDVMRSIRLGLYRKRGLVPHAAGISGYILELPYVYARLTARRRCRFGFA